MKKNILLLFLIFIGISTTISSQEIAKDTVPKKDTTKLAKLVEAAIKDTVPRKETKKDTIIEKKLEKHFYGIRQFTHETYLFIATPTRWHPADWLRVGGVIAVTAAIIPFDQSLNTTFKGKPRTFYTQNFNNTVPDIAGRVYGEWYSIGIVTAAFAGYGILAHDTAAKKIAIELFQAGVYSELFTEVLKIGIGRDRPYLGKGSFTFHPFSLNNDYESMPSGHATSAFALSTVMFRHAHSTFWKIMSFVPAGFTVYSRLHQDFHWSSDLFFGAATGFATGMWVVTLHERKLHKINVAVDPK
jgi:membrane-associated phospholipid phosphatase